MAVNERCGLMTYKEENGDKTILYPVTKKECVDGLEPCDEHLKDTNNPHKTNSEQVMRPNAQSVEEALAANESATQKAQETANEAKGGLSNHNTSTDAHADLRRELKDLTDRINAALDSDDATLDELSEIVAYIKNNKSLIDAITVTKVNVADIIDNLVSNIANQPLSAAQGVVLKGLIDALQNAVNGKAPINHAASNTTYGAGTASNYGHVRLSDAIDGESGANGGVAATPAAVKSAYDAARKAKEEAEAAQNEIGTHNSNAKAHTDIRAELKALSDRVNAALDSDDETLDELSEIVAYIKSNKTLIDAVTTSKVSISDIVNNLTTNAENKPLSAAQGVLLKQITDAIAAKAEDAIAIAKEAQEKASESAGGCAITITFDQGFKGKTYTVTDGNGDTHTDTVPDGLVATVNVKNCATTYTISATASNGVTYSSAVTTGAYYGQYKAALKVFAASITVTAVPGAVITITGEHDTFKLTAGSNGQATADINRAGEYSVVATYSGATSSITAVSAAEEGAYNVAVTFATLAVTIDSGSAVTVTNGSKTLSATSDGSVLFYLPEMGTWQISVRKGDQSASGTVSVSDYKAYAIELSYVKIFGVCWAKTSSTALSRLTKANDPNAYVNVDITTEPSPAVGIGTGSSPFDAYAPWNGMEEYNVVSNAVSSKKGQSGFSRTGNDTVVYIPEYWFKIVENDGKRYFYVADKATDGFTKHPGSGKYVGRYQTGANYVSKSGQSPLTNISRATARTGSKNKGSKWGQYDYASWCAVWLLYLVEYADWDSQSVIGRGNVDSGSVSNTGGTDSMTYHTGRAAGTDGSTQIQYRNIEDPWGNVFEWIDGVNFSAGAVYVCTDPAKYADDTETDYTNVGTKAQTRGYIQDIGLSTNAPWAFYPTTTGGSETTYIPDCAYYLSGWRVLLVGGSYSLGSGAGLFCFSASRASSDTYASVGARLLYHP